MTRMHSARCTTSLSFLLLKVHRFLSSLSTLVIFGLDNNVTVDFYTHFLFSNLFLPSQVALDTKLLFTNESMRVITFYVE